MDDNEYWLDIAKHWKIKGDEKEKIKIAKKSVCGNCAAFDLSPRMKECMPGAVQEDGRLGYCWMHKFKCHSSRTCYTWAAGGPIKEDKISKEWEDKA